jgi:DNA-binding response OmpR family regulator
LKNQKVNMSGKVVLLAEDNLVIKKNLQTVSTKNNIKVLIANNGEEAVTLYKDNSETIDLVLMILDCHYWKVMKQQKKF